jgi:CBS domain-containing protein
MKPIGEFYVADIMTSGPFVIGEADPIRDALEVFEDTRVSAIPVVDQSGAVTGILSLIDLVPVMRETQADLSAMWTAQGAERQVVMNFLREESGTLKISEIMTTPVDTIKATDNIVVAAQRMSRQNYRHLPVVDHENRPVGMLSSTDFVRAIADIGALMAG